MEKRTVRAKINLTLDITDKAEDFHHIRSLFLKIPIEAEGMFWDSPGLFRMEHLEIPYNQSKAYQTYKKRQCSAYIYKSVPTGFGLGGSSAEDALIASYTHVEPSSRDAYFLMGKSKLGVVEGDQSVISPVPLPFSLELLIVFPEYTSQTTELYRRWDEAPLYTDFTQRALEAIQKSDKDAFERSFGNVLETYVDDQLAEVREYLRTCGPFVMTGSGSAFFAPLKKIRTYPKLPYKILFIERWSP